MHWTTNAYLFGFVICTIINIIGVLHFKNTKTTTNSTKITPTPTPSIKLTKAVSYKNNYQSAQNNQNSNLSTIPSTGSPTTTLIFSISALLSGIYLKKRS